jgi:hypothetical protein
MQSPNGAAVKRLAKFLRTVVFQKQNTLVEAMQKLDTSDSRKWLQAEDCTALTLP